MIALTRWRFGMKRRLVMAVTCVPMPPCFLGLPLRQIMLPFIGPLPVNSQNRPIRILLQKGAQNLTSKTFVASHYLTYFKLPILLATFILGLLTMSDRVGTLTCAPSVAMLGAVSGSLTIDFFLIAACYCLGCFTSGYYWVRWRTGQDVRQLGSGS